MVILQLVGLSLETIYFSYTSFKLQSINQLDWLLAAITLSYRGVQQLVWYKSFRSVVDVFIVLSVFYDMCIRRVIMLLGAFTPASFL